MENIKLSGSLTFIIKYWDCEWYDQYTNSKSVLPLFTFHRNVKFQLKLQGTERQWE